MLWLASLQCSNYYTALSESEMGGLKLHGSHPPHHQQMLESKVPLAVMLIGSDCHVGMLWCGVGKEFLLRGVLHAFEYHNCFLF